MGVGGCKTSTSVHGYLRNLDTHKKTSRDFLRPYQRNTQINDRHYRSLICEESGNHVFRFPRSKKPRMDFLRPYQKETPCLDTVLLKVNWTLQG